MSSIVSIRLHHHGDFSVDSFRGNCLYKHGRVDIIKDIDTDKLSILDLVEYGAMFNYDETDCLYFQTDGHTFKKGIRLCYDDDSVRNMINICLPFKEIKLFVDHQKKFEPPPNRDKDIDCATGDVVNEKADIDIDIDEMFGSEEEMVKKGGETDKDMTDSEDPDYEVESEIQMSEPDTDSEIDKSQFYKSQMIEEEGDSDDDYEFGSDELRSEEESSGDELLKQGYVGVPPGNKRKKVHKLYNPNKKDNLKFEIGMKFSSMEEFRSVVRDYGIRERRSIHFITNDPERVQVGCERGCRFYMWCSKLKGSDEVQIRTLLDDHLCTKPYQNILVSVKYLTEKYGERIRQNPQWKVKEMQVVIREELEVEVPRIKCSRVRKAALEGVIESLKQHYARVWDFGYELLKNDSRNRVEVKTSRVSDEDINKFQRMYICYHALKVGWKQGCRPVLGVDGCFLKTICRGQLLSAVGRDGNNQMYPVAFAVVETESTDSWKWFIELLAEDLELGDGHGYTIISNQNKTRVQKELEVPGLQRYNGGRIIHCSYCGVAGHKRPTCPKRIADETGANEGGATGGTQCGNEGGNEGGYEGGNEAVIEGEQEPKRPATKAKKSKLTIRRAQPGIVIREPVVGVEAGAKTISSVENLSKKKQKVVVSQRKEGSTSKGKSHQVPRSFRERMVFMPTPGFTLNHDDAILGFTPSADTPPTNPAAAPPSPQPDVDIVYESEENEGVEDEPRRSNRLWLKTKFNFKNTPDTTISLDDDQDQA